jgi:catechol 2,3-dioxygenase-like lactoylglutathione lyase family enzyme
MSYSLTLSHVGIFVADMGRMIDFYTRFLGFAVSDRGSHPHGEIVFMTRDPREHHQLVMATGRPAQLQFNVINQISFRVDSLATLRELCRGLKDEAVGAITPVTHGNALSVYFRDPESNRVELLIDTPWYVPQPCRIPVDLFQPDDALWASIEVQVRAMPGYLLREEWAAEIEKKIAQATAQRRSAGHVKA